MRRTPGVVASGTRPIRPRSDRRGEALRAPRAPPACPSPRFSTCSRSATALGDGFLMEWLEGETLGARIVRGEEFAAIRPKLARQCGEVLARIHAIDVAAAGLADRSAHPRPGGARPRELGPLQDVRDAAADDRLRGPLAAREPAAASSAPPRPFRLPQRQPHDLSGARHRRRPRLGDRAPRRPASATSAGCARTRGDSGGAISRSAASARSTICSTDTHRSREGGSIRRT